MFSKFVIQCLAMLSNNEVTEGLLIAVLGANFVLLFFIVWHVATARLYFRQVHRLTIAITEKMDCDELIDDMLSCSGEKLRNDKGTAGDSLVSPDACSGGTAGQQQLLRNDKVTGQKAVPDRVQNYRVRLASVAAGGQAGRSGLLAHGKTLTASHIEELDDSEIERLYARYKARLGAAMTKTLGSAALQLYAGVVSMFLPIPAENQPGLIADLEGDPFGGTHLAVPPTSYTIGGTSSGLKDICQKQDVGTTVQVAVVSQGLAPKGHPYLLRMGVVLVTDMRIRACCRRLPLWGVWAQ